MAYLDTLTNLLQQFAWLGNWLFFILAFIESAPFLGLLIPGATLVSVGGFFASQGFLNVWDIIIYAALGAIVGDFSSYFLGRWGGDWIRSKKIINQKLLGPGEKFFARYGNKSIFWGRFFGPIRAIIPFVAGLSKMPPKPFISWNILSGIFWSIFNVTLGYFSGSVFALIVKKWSMRLGIIIAILISGAIVYWIINLIIEKKESIIIHFQHQSDLFMWYLSEHQWFKRLTNRHTFINIFLQEDPAANQKFFGLILFFGFSLFIYLLIVVLDVF